MATWSSIGTFRKLAGWIVLSLVSAVLLFAGVAKAAGLLPEENLAQLGPLADQVRLIGLGALLSGITLLIPRTSSIGLLLCSAYWGGAICTHMLQETPYTVPAALLVMTWIGAALRDPRSLWSFTPERNVPAESRPGATPLGEQAAISPATDGE